jgi:hypothetical protein
MNGNEPRWENGPEIWYNPAVDVLITPEARREFEAVRALRAGPSTWGLLIGHKRGFRFIVEKIFPAGAGPAGPGERLITELERIWPGRLIGLFAVRPGTAFRKAVLGPLFYGKLILRPGMSSGKPAIRASIVEFERKFTLKPVPLAPAGKAKAHE